MRTYFGVKPAGYRTGKEITNIYRSIKPGKPFLKYFRAKTEKIKCQNNYLCRDLKHEKYQIQTSKIIIYALSP